MTRALVLFDADCGFCTRSTEVASGPVFAAKVDFTALQWADLDAHGITRPEALELMHMVLEDGAVVKGAPAWAQILRRSRGAWPLVGWTMGLPGARHLADLVYRLIAANRASLPGGTAACAMPPAPTPGSSTDAGHDPVDPAATEESTQAEAGRSKLP